MRRVHTLVHEFVEYLPDTLAAGVLYVSMRFATVGHKCCCGCGNDVITPLSPSDWQLTFDGTSISLQPSIGNWSFDCQSHYWIRRNTVRWAAGWSKEQIADGRANDRYRRARQLDAADSDEKPAVESDTGEVVSRESLWRFLLTWLRLRR